jgi:hypothetical protein
MLQTQLLEVLQEQNAMTEKRSLKMLNLESHAVNTMMNRVASMSMFDPATLQGFVGEPMDMYALARGYSTLAVAGCSRG